MGGGACGYGHRCRWKETQRSGGVSQKGRFDFLMYRTRGAREIRAELSQCHKGRDATHKYRLNKKKGICFA